MATKAKKTYNWAMIRTYANLVKNGRRTIDSVPEAYRQDVKDYIDGKIKP